MFPSLFFKSLRKALLNVVRNIRKFSFSWIAYFSVSIRSPISDALQREFSFFLMMRKSHRACRAHDKMDWVTMKYKVSEENLFHKDERYLMEENKIHATRETWREKCWYCLWVWHNGNASSNQDVDCRPWQTSDWKIKSHRWKGNKRIF